MSINEKLFNIQKSLVPIVKDAKNDYFKSSYTTLNAVNAVLVPLLNAEGLILNQQVYDIDDRVGVETVITELESGETKVTKISLSVEGQTPQYAGGVISYLRRYSLVSFFNMTAEDDDGNSISRMVLPSKMNDEFNELVDCPLYTPAKKAKAVAWWAGMSTLRQAEAGLEYMRGQVEKWEQKQLKE